VHSAIFLVAVVK